MTWCEHREVNVSKITKLLMYKQRIGKFENGTSASNARVAYDGTEAEDRNEQVDHCECSPNHQALAEVVVH